MCLSSNRQVVVVAIAIVVVVVVVVVVASHFLIDSIFSLDVEIV